MLVEPVAGSPWNGWPDVHGIRGRINVVRAGNPLYILETIDEVRQIATEWLCIYNNGRPNMGIGGLTPAMKLKMAA